MVLVLTVIIKVLHFIERVEQFCIRMFQSGVLAISIVFLFLFVRVAQPLTDALISQYHVLPTYTPDVLGSSSKAALGPVLTDKQPYPALTSKAALVVSVQDDKILYELNAEEKLAPASTTKLMTAMVSLDIFSEDETFEVPALCTEVDSTRVGLPAGMKVSVNDLLNSLLISSAGDSACVLSTAKTPQNEFVTIMNKKAQKLGMTDSNFTNPIGLDGDNGSHYSTARDLYKLAKAAMKNKMLSSIVSKKDYEIDDSAKNISLRFYNTNKLLWEIPETVGIKTGTTQSAGEVLIYEYRSDQLPKKDLIIIVMGSNDRFSDTKALLDWALKSYAWH